MCRDSDSICSKYAKGYKEALELALSYRIEVMKKIGMTDEKIQNLLLEEYYLFGYFVLCNLFKKGSPLSFNEKIVYIRGNILDDKRFRKGFYASYQRQNNLFTNVYNFCFRCNNATLMACVFGLLYKLKYNFKKFYLKLLPYMKK